MPTWGDILNRLKELQEQGEEAPFDVVRRDYLDQLNDFTGRDVILYATAWTQPTQASQPLLTLTDEDMEGFMEAIHNVGDDGLDLILHSPGGSPEATEPIVRYLREKFNDIRVFVPHAAMSAATMLCCACDEIVMGRHSSLGPIDTQLILQTPQGQRSVPAQAILDQFDLAKEECQDPANLGYWTPILRQYGPSLLEECEAAIELSIELAREWAEVYHFKGEDDASEQADRLVSHLSDYQQFRSHSRHIDRDQAREFGFKVQDLEDNQDLQDLVLSVYHATMHTLSSTNAVKIIENHHGTAFIKQASAQMVQVPQQSQGGPEGFGGLEGLPIPHDIIEQLEE